MLHQVARAARVPLTEATLRLVETDELKPKTRATLRSLMQDFDCWRQLMGRLPHTELAGLVLDESGYTGSWQQDKSLEAAGRLENMKEIVASMEESENLGGFLHHVSLLTDHEPKAAGYK